MKSFTLAAVVASLATAVSADCHADNCARAVTGTRLGPAFVSSARADCSTRQTHTEIAPAVTETQYVTVQAPTYASACSGLVRYSSACSCWGITATTSVVTPTITTTSTIYIDGSEA